MKINELEWINAGQEVVFLDDCTLKVWPVERGVFAWKARMLERQYSRFGHTSSAQEAKEKAFESYETQRKEIEAELRPKFCLVKETP